MTGVPARPVPFVTRIRVRDFRSIAGCDVTPGPLTVLLGFNASGKSNFLDVLRFVADALETSPSHAAAERGGLDALLRRGPGGQADSFEIGLDLALPSVEEGGEPVTAFYGFTIGRSPGEDLSLRVLGEECRYGVLSSWVNRFPLPSRRSRTRLVLPAAASDDERLAVLEESLRAMRFHELDSETLRALDEDTVRGSELGPAGQHLGQVLGGLERGDPLGKERLDAYLAALVPNALGVDERREGRYSTVEARFQAGDDANNVEVFPREALSEGTLRAAGVLAALFQPPAFDGRIPLLGIEEPETALHPAAVGALYEALDDAAQRTQVIVTSQSSDLLDNEYVRLEHIRAVANVDGVTHIGEVDAAGQAIIDKQLMTISELHRSGQLMPALPDPPGAGSR
jgi:predicted ATPase